jgi:tripartite-type tricarboxylate transporter receptor subunit TctC
MEGKMKKHLFNLKIALFFCVVSILCVPMLGYSQEEEIAKYPSRPITYIQPFTAGVPADLAIRLISKEAEKILGQPIVVVNKPGAAGTIGVASIAASKPDGYTIGNAPHSPMIVVPHLEKVPYHPVKDIKMIMQFGAFNMGLIVKSDSPFKTFKDLIDFARQNPKKLTYGTAGSNSMQYIIIEQIAKKEKIQITHIPFKATGEAQTALLGGHILFAAGDFNYSLIEAREARVLFLFREERAAEYPDTPVLKDLGYDYPFPTFICAAGPKAIPDGIVRKLEDALAKAMKEPSFIKGMKEDLRLPIVYRGSKELNDYVANSYEVYGKMLKEMGLMK